MNRQKLFYPELFSFCEYIRSQSSKIACQRSQQQHGHKFFSRISSRKQKISRKVLTCFYWAQVGFILYKKGVENFVTLSL